MLIAKPTGMLDHGGDQPLELDGDEAKLLFTWIRNGARRLKLRHLQRLTVEPHQAMQAQVSKKISLKVLALFDDGTKQDVTSSVVYAADDPAAVAVSLSGQLTVHRSGQHTVVVRYLDAVVPVQVTVPLSVESIDLADRQRGNWIDDYIYQSLEALRIRPAEPVDDAQFLRRATLDLTGRIPRPQEVRQFLADENTNKRQQLVDHYLHSTQFTEYWAYQLAKLLRIQTQPKDKQGALAFHRWIQQQIELGTPYDQFARQLLTAEGDTHQNGPANFHRVSSTARDQAEFVSETLLGVRLRCANCHNHPLDRWTQDDYHGLAAIFARIERGQVIRVLSRGEVTHPRTGEVARPRLPGARFLHPSDDLLLELARWISAKENPYFAKAIVNRLWKAMMGRGLIEPVDDLRQSNPATHPELLERLASDFVEHGYDLRHTLRLIAESAAYARGRTGDFSDGFLAERFYAQAGEKTLPAEVLSDALSDVTAISDRYGDFPPGTRAITLYDSQVPSESLDILGRCDRRQSCEAESQNSGGLSTKLHLINGALINRKITDPQGHLRKMLDTGLANQQIVEDFYLRSLGRFPRDKEQSFWNGRLGSTENKTARRELLEDFLWSLLSSREFTTNH